MNGNDLLRKLRTVARSRGLELRVDTKRGKGDHAVVWLGDKRTVLPGLRQEIKTGTLLAILKQLGIDRSEL